MKEKMLKKIFIYVIIKISGLFDKEYYIKAYPDIKEKNIDPLYHYILYGWKEERNPSRYFDTHFYLSKYPDVEISGINPLYHFIISGRSEYRLPAPQTRPSKFKNSSIQNEPWYIRLIRYVKHENLAQKDQSATVSNWEKARTKHPWEQNKTNLEPGINILGYFQTSKGIAEAARSNMRALDRTHVPYSVVNFKSGIPNRQLTEAVPENKSYGEFRYNTNLFHVNPPQLPQLWGTFKENNLTNRYNIGVWYWELPKFPESWLFAFSLVDEVWVASQFVMESVSSKSTVPVIKIPPCIHVDCDSRLSRENFNLPDNRFLFMCAYDVLSSQARKNPFGAIEAFRRAFDKSDPSVGLVIKVNNAPENQLEIQLLREEFNHDNNIYLIDNNLDRLSMNTLINLTDAYISLHRSEGFGLVPAEAMYLGKPVIMTKWSGNLELMTENNSCGVGYQLIPLEENHGPYTKGQFWADPNIDQAASFMKRLRDDQLFYRLISTNAEDFIRNQFSPEIIGLLIENRLRKIGLI